MNMKTKILIGGAATIAIGATTYMVVKKAKEKKAEKEATKKSISETKEEVKHIQAEVSKEEVIKDEETKNEKVSENKDNKSNEKSEEELRFEKDLKEATEISENHINSVCKNSGVENLEELLEKNIKESIEEEERNKILKEETKDDTTVDNDESLMSIADIIEKLEDDSNNDKKET